MNFSEYSAGQVLKFGNYKIDEAEILEFAERYDPQWFHTNIEKANTGPYGGLIASGIQTLGIAMRLVADELLAGSSSYGSPGLDYLKWPNPVRPGDVLSVVVTIVETKQSRSRPNLGILRWQWQLFNDRGDEVLNLEATSFFELS